MLPKNTDPQYTGDKLPHQVYGSQILYTDYALFERPINLYGYLAGINSWCDKSVLSITNFNAKKQIEIGKMFIWSPYGRHNCTKQFGFDFDDWNSTTEDVTIHIMKRHKQESLKYNYNSYKNTWDNIIVEKNTKGKKFLNTKLNGNKYNYKVANVANVTVKEYTISSANKQQTNNSNKNSNNYTNNNNKKTNNNNNNNKKNNNNKNKNHEFIDQINDLQIDYNYLLIKHGQRLKFINFPIFHCNPATTGVAFETRAAVIANTDSRIDELYKDHNQRKRMKGYLKTYKREVRQLRDKCIVNGYEFLEPFISASIDNYNTIKEGVKQISKAYNIEFDIVQARISYVLPTLIHYNFTELCI